MLQNAKNSHFCIEDLEQDEIALVCGGEAPSYSVYGRGPQTSLPTAGAIASGANGVAIAAQGASIRSTNVKAKAAFEIVALAAAGVGWAASLFDDPKAPTNKKAEESRK